MNKILVFVISTSLFISCNNKKEVKSTADTDTTVVPAKLDSLLITDTSWGPITIADDIETLKQKFGSASIKDERICASECMDSIDVTFLHTGSKKAITIYWRDSAYHKNISSVEAADTASPYYTSAGLHMGSTLNDVLKINGKKLGFSGFGWDYGGFVGFYNGGALEKSALSLQLDYAQHPGDEGLYGDRELNTDMPLVKKNLDKIIVTGMTLYFKW